MISSVTL